MSKIAILLCVCLALGAMINANPDELAQLQNILQQTRGSWEAAETSFSQLSAIEQEQMLGLLPGVFDMENLPEETISEEMVRLTDYEAPHTPIRDQGSCGSCYSFGASASYESYMLTKHNKTCDLSEQDFMMKAKATGPYGGCSGWYLDTSMNLLKDQGVADEYDCGYKAKEESCPSSAKAKNQIKEWAVTSDKSTIQNALQNNGAVYVGFAVYSDFSYYSTGYYEYTSGYRRGYHAVAVVGYDNTGFTVKNSWGTGWGDNGYFKIKYNQMDNAIQFGTCFGGSYYITKTQ
jgi:C1A family cysteine protease